MQYGVLKGCSACSAALSTADAKQQQVDEEAQRSELLGTQGKRATRPQPDVESAFGALFGGTKVHGKPAQDDSASHESDAAHGRGAISTMFRVYTVPAFCRHPCFCAGYRNHKLARKTWLL